mgnify:CR=1 FL=1
MWEILLITNKIVRKNDKSYWRTCWINARKKCWFTQSFKYNNEAIEYDGDLVDRGYDHLITIVKVDKGEPSLVYRYYQLDESESTEKWYK